MRYLCLALLCVVCSGGLALAQLVPGGGGGSSAGGSGNVTTSGSAVAGQLASFTTPTNVEGVSSLGILYDGAQVSGNGTIATSVEYVSGTATRTLPAAASATALRQLRVVKQDAVGTLTVAPAGSDTINGTAGALPGITIQWAGWLLTENLATGWSASYLAPSSAAGGSSFATNLSVSNTAPSLTLTDTTGAAKSLLLAVDANAAQLREAAAATTSLLNFDLTNNRVGIGGAPGTFPLEVTGDIGPEADGTRALGSTTKRYNVLYSKNVSSVGQTLILTSTGGSVNTIMNSNLWLIVGGGEGSIPSTVGVRGPNAIGTNVNGTTFTIQAPLGTGTGTVSTLVFKAPAVAQASGTTVHVASDHMTIGAGKIIFNSAAVTPAASGTRYICIDTTGQIASSASACSGT